MSADAIPGNEEQLLFDALIRSDFVTFLAKVFRTVAPAEELHANWHIDAIVRALDEVERGEERQLVINLPPRYLKSIIVSVAWVAWLLGHNPARQIIVASYSAELATKHANDFRKVVTAPWFRRAFPGFSLSQFKNTETEIQTSSGGFRLATSVGGSLTGRGADIIIIDDPLKAEDALSKDRRERVNTWFDTTLLSRLNDKRRGAIIIVMQRLHINDLTGHVLRKGSWRRLSLPAIAQTAESIRLGPGGQVHIRNPGDLLDPEREPQDVLDIIKSNMGTFAFTSQYLQEPVPPEGQLVKLAWFRHYDLSPGAKEDDLVVLSLDTAYKPGEQNDFSVCTVWRVRDDLQQAYLTTLWRDRVDFPQLTKKVIELNCFYDADLVLIEDAGSGTALIQTLSDQRHPTVPIKPTADKETRLSTGSVVIEAGQIYLPTKKCPWLDDFMAELTAFPHSMHDDQVDSLSQFLNWLLDRRRNRRSRGGAYINGVFRPVPPGISRMIF